ncbi:MAG: xanthine dehydrogenase family protein molybdopterin-binding subunit [Actinomycetota bacterium]|nr:xanthine dehydrogenase family protein molybdopterin-binding subunit [Actinomycetota bacterium]
MTDTATNPFTGGVVGQRRVRKEDPALLTGEAKFIDDLHLPGALWVACVRSPHAHARISAIDTSAALTTDGVVTVYTGDDLTGDWAAPLPCAWPVTEDMKNPAHLPVAVGKANYAGDIVAVVVAESRYAAADGLEGVVVDYEPLDAVVTMEAARSDNVVIHDDLGTNVSYVWELTPDPDGLAAAFDEAAHHITETYLQQRLIPAAMEPRGVAAVPAPHNGDITLYSSTQIPHILKVMAAITLGLPEQKVRVVAPSVGGGFGSKLDVYAEEIICMALANRHGVPVRWTESRTEAAGSTIQGRGQIQTMELAADAEGRLKAVRATLVADMGAYLQLVTPGVPLLGAFLYHGLYDVPLYSFTCTGVFTNLTPTDAYRGAGRPEATYAIERAMDALAEAVGVGPDEIRSRNYIPADKFPYDSPAGLVFDSGNYQPTLDRAKELVDWDSLRTEQAQRRASGSKLHLGLGISSYVEMCGLAPSRTLAALNYSAGGWESATVRILPTCKVQVVTGATPHGQGHETCWSMIVADRLGVDPDDVEVLHSDTAITPLGMDTYGSRSLSVGGTALWMATEKVVGKATGIAAHMLEANPEDLEFSGGVFSVKGSPGSEVPLAGVAFGAFTAHDLPDGVEPNLEAQVTWDPTNFTFPFGTHIAVVEVDEDTGSVRLVDYGAVDDCGNQINPMIVEGQIHGGIVQGVAQALWEDAVYDDEGQLRSANLADYLVPSAAECIDMKLESTVTPSPTNPMGVKGIGEAGTIASTPAVINAVVDALRPLGVTDVAMPASPMNVRQAITAAEGGAS